MIIVLIVAKSSLLGDAMESQLAQEQDLRVYRMRSRDQRAVDQAIDLYRPGVIIIEEEILGNDGIITTSLFRNQGRLLVIIISAEKHQIQIWDSYQVPVSGLAGLVTLIKSVDRM